jgi:uncharacterized membrane protein YphA (DoxX/SURF4 family)
MSSVFPGGLAAVGLLLLRLALGLVTSLQGLLYLAGPRGLTVKMAVFGALSLVSGIMLVLGFLTSVVGTVVGLGIIGIALSGFPSSECNLFDGTLPRLFSGIVSVAIVLLGPGALSVDARLFGRREIIIPSISRTPK